MWILRTSLILVVFIQVRFLQQVNGMTFLSHQEEIVEMAIENQVMILGMVDTITIDLVDAVVPMLPQVVVIVVPQ